MIIGALVTLCVALAMQWVGGRLAMNYSALGTGLGAIAQKVMASKRRMFTFGAIVVAGASIVLAVLNLLYSMSWIPPTIAVVLSITLAFNLSQLIHDWRWQVRWALCAYVIGVAVVWFASPNWLATNLMTINFGVVIMGSMMVMSVSFKWWSLLCWALVAYDALNVYITGQMLQLAKHTLTADRAPASLLAIPAEVQSAAEPNHALAYHPQLISVLGLGDIVLPASMILPAVILSYLTGRKVLMVAGFASYAVGLAIAFVGMHALNAAQPALVYIVPCVFFGIMLTARMTGMWGHLVDLPRALDAGDYDHDDEVPEGKTAAV